VKRSESPLVAFQSKCTSLHAMLYRCAYTQSKKASGAALIRYSVDALDPYQKSKGGKLYRYSLHVAYYLGMLSRLCNISKQDNQTQ